VVVANALSKVDVGLNGVTLVGVQMGTENRDTIVALEVKGDVGSRAGEAWVELVYVIEGQEL